MRVAPDQPIGAGPSWISVNPAKMASRQISTCRASTQIEQRCQRDQASNEDTQGQPTRRPEQPLERAALDSGLARHAAKAIR
ncbi:hypothetical protein DB30_06601 [Enhygromyxa salina]|uniref:Uncharacterized protein n=1 Tax=Enhygromyxa salina TaxID=215803 RepID=A0A0C2DC03_9BACT|nr:hypothetical protein DB30_06601 [Enhygromyxa salina]